MSNDKTISELASELRANHPSLFREPSSEEMARIEVERQRQEQARRKRQEQKRRQQWAAWGVPSKDIPRIVDKNFERTRALAEISAFEEQRFALLVLSGPVGCGKTTAAAQWLTRARRRATFVKLEPRMFLPVAQCARLNRFDDNAMVLVERARALVLDDLGAEYLDDKGAFTSLLDSIIDARYRHLLPTVITTNLRAAEFKARYGERTIDRLRERGEFIELKGASLRGGQVRP